MLESLGQTLKFGELLEQKRSRHEFSGIPAHEKKEWDFAVVDTDKGKRHFRVFDGNRVFNFEIDGKPGKDQSMPLRRLADLHRQDLHSGKVVQKGMLQIGKSSPTGIEATMSQGGKTMTFGLGRGENGWAITPIRPRPTNAQLTRGFVQTLSKAAEHHHERIICKCGNEQTCRCSAPKTVVHVESCWSCEEKTAAIKPKGKKTRVQTYEDECCPHCEYVFPEKCYPKVLNREDHEEHGAPEIMECPECSRKFTDEETSDETIAKYENSGWNISDYMKERREKRRKWIAEHPGWDDDDDDDDDGEKAAALRPDKLKRLRERRGECLDCGEVPRKCECTKVRQVPIEELVDSVSKPKTAGMTVELPFNSLNPVKEVSGAIARRTTDKRKEQTRLQKLLEAFGWTAAAGGAAYLGAKTTFGGDEGLRRVHDLIGSADRIRDMADTDPSGSIRTYIDKAVPVAQSSLWGIPSTKIMDVARLIPNVGAATKHHYQSFRDGPVSAYREFIPERYQTMPIPGFENDPEAPKRFIEGYDKVILHATKQLQGRENTPFTGLNADEQWQIWNNLDEHWKQISPETLPIRQAAERDFGPKGKSYAGNYSGAILKPILKVRGALQQYVGFPLLAAGGLGLGYAGYKAIQAFRDKRRRAREYDQAFKTAQGQPCIGSNLTKLSKVANWLSKSNNRFEFGLGPHEKAPMKAMSKLDSAMLPNIPNSVQVTAHGGGPKDIYMLSEHEGPPKADAIGMAGDRFVQYKNQKLQITPSSPVPTKVLNSKPSTVMSLACNPEGGGCPQFYQNMFGKSVKTVAAIPPGKVSLSGSGLSRGLMHLGGLFSPDPVSMPHVYSQEGDQWKEIGQVVPRGDAAFNFLNKPRSAPGMSKMLTTPIPQLRQQFGKEYDGGGWLQKNSSLRESFLSRIRAGVRGVNRKPTEKQQQAGNYRMGHFWIQGLDITVENPKGSVRSGKTRDGVVWRTVMENHYGYIRNHPRSLADGDHVDVFVGDHPDSEVVYVVDQYVDGKFDEHKVMVGFTNQAEAKQAYLSNFDDNWSGFKAITPLTMQQFKAWLKSGGTKKPIASQKLTGLLKRGENCGDSEVYCKEDLQQKKCQKSLKKAFVLKTDSLLFPLSGKPALQGVAAGAAVGSGAGLLLGLARRGLGASQVDEEGETEPRDVWGDALRGAAAGALISGTFQGARVLGGERVPNAHPEPLDLKTAAIDAAVLRQAILNDRSMNSWQQQKLVAELAKVELLRIELDPNNLILAGFGGLAGFIASKLMGMGGMGQLAGTAFGSAAGLMASQSPHGTIKRQGYYIP